MKPRNREVNIFNMSLLDILCGALGAFCFMMLSLFPDHAKVKDLQAKLASMTHSSGGNAEARAQQAEQREQQAEQRAKKAEQDLQKAKGDQSLILFKLEWTGPQDIDLWIEGSAGKYCAPKEELIPAAKRGGYGKFDDVKKGPAVEQAWFSDIARPGVWYRFFARLQNRNGDRTPAFVHPYMAARNSSAQRDVMTVHDFENLPLPKENELMEIGWIEFTADSFTITKGPKPNGDRLGAQLFTPQLFTPPTAVAANQSAVGSDWGRVDRWR